MKILPDPRRVEEIKFLFAKNITYKQRLALVVSFFVLGLVTQLLLSFWLGIILLAAATALSLIKGYSDKPVPVGEETWAQVTPDEYEKVKVKQAEHRRWDLDCFDITNKLGGFIFIVVGAVCWLVWFFLEAQGNSLAAFYWAADCVVILLPHWVSGVRTFLTRDKLIIKIDLLKHIMQLLAAPSDIQVLPMLSTQETEDKGRIPTDARLMLRFLNAPSYFLGVQVQISINTVEGKDYPYLYCVIIAKQEAGLFKKKHDIIYSLEPDNITFEETASEGVDVLVIRQLTSKTSGYYTNTRASSAIVDTAIAVARKIITN